MKYKFKVKYGELIKKSTKRCKCQSDNKEKVQYKIKKVNIEVHSEDERKALAKIKNEFGVYLVSVKRKLFWDPRGLFFLAKSTIRLLEF